MQLNISIAGEYFFFKYKFEAIFLTSVMKLILISRGGVIYRGPQSPIYRGPQSPTFSH